MRRELGFRICVLTTAAIATMAAGFVLAQTPLVDYESSAKAAQVREAAAWRLAFRPALPVMQQTVNQLRNTFAVPSDTQAQAEALVREASTQPDAEARRTLWHAVILLSGGSWSPAQEMLGALALRAPTSILSTPQVVLAIDAMYSIKAHEKASYRLDLFVSEATTSATPKKGARLRSLARGTLQKSFPSRIAVKLSGVADGAYLLVCNVSAGAASTELVQPIYVINNLEARHVRLKGELEGVHEHDEAKWIAEYPYVLAEAVKAGTREIISYDFPQALARTARILSALKEGRDEIHQAKGLQNRAYRFEETGELIPYQLYIPSTWSADKKWPLVVALHGANLDETNMLGRNGGRMQQLAEAQGFIVVAPLGYRLNSVYGSQRGASTAIAGNDEVRKRRSEQDVLFVTELVGREYNVDPRRRYLTGNSMGGGGTWWIGGRYPQMWAAIAPVAYGGVQSDDVTGLREIPILAVVGDRDELGMLERVRSSVAILRAGGVSPEFIEVSGGTHASAFDIALPDIFEFFAKHAK